MVPDVNVYLKYLASLINSRSTNKMIDTSGLSPTYLIQAQGSEQEYLIIIGHLILSNESQWRGPNHSSHYLIRMIFWSLKSQQGSLKESSHFLK